MNRILIKFIVFLLWVMVGCAFANTTNADKDSTRIRIGLKLFRTILAADTKIKEKKDANGELPLAIIYKQNQSQAVLYAQKLQNLGKGKNQGKIKKIPIVVKTFSSDQIDQLAILKPAGVYIVEELESHILQQLVDYGISRKVITYSPFEGAVEKGITAGLIIDARVKPYLNNKTLTTSQLQLKSFFLKVSKHYEP